ncbi:MAG TPA: ferritin-like domain-containing protein [Bacteroidales bacterium]|nr:ferritin-like domain-containing protein [Bacteroidales bacterium]
MSPKSKSAKSKNSEKNTIHELFEHQLQDILWAEQELTNFMPEIVEQISSKELVNTLQEHMKVTEKQISRLDNIFELIGAEKKAEKCDGMEGLIKEARSIVEMADEGVVRDAFIIGAVQKMEHYEMAGYGTLKAIAAIIGEYEVSSLLGETLEEEKEADMKLTEVAESVVNINASMESGELEDEEGESGEDETEEETSAISRSGSKSKSSSKAKSKSR